MILTYQAMKVKRQHCNLWREWANFSRKIGKFKKVIETSMYQYSKWESIFSLWLNAAKNTHRIKKKLKIKVVQNWISYKKVHERICLSPPGMEPGGSKDSHLWKIIMYKNGEVDSVWGSTPPKIRIASKKALNKSCSKLNFIQESPRAQMSIFPPASGARVLERFPSVKIIHYYF